MEFKKEMKMKENSKWKKEVKEEHGNFTRCDVVKTVSKEEVPDDATIIRSTYAMNKKPAGTHRDRLNSRDNEQMDST